MANSISLTDLDETIINPSGSTIHFGNVSFPAETLTHLIKFNGGVLPLSFPKVPFLYIFK